MGNGEDQMLLSRELKVAAFLGDHQSKNGWWVPALFSCNCFFWSIGVSFFAYRFFSVKWMIFFSLY